MRVKYNGRNVKVEVSSDGEGLVSHAGTALLGGLADKTGLTAALSGELLPLYARRPQHDPGGLIRDLAVMLAAGGDALSDLAAVRDQGALFGAVASDSTAFRLVDRIASQPSGIGRLEAAHAAGRARAWELIGAPKQLTIDVDATLLTAHSDKEGAAGNYKGGYGFHPMLAYGDETGEAMGAVLRAGNAGANTATDQIAAAEQAVGQIPAKHAARIDLLLRVDTAGATHRLLDWAREGQIRFSVGYDLTDAVRQAILEVPEKAWAPTLTQDDKERPNGHVAEITSRLDLTKWPSGSRVIVRRERPHPGAQLTFTDHDGYRFQAILTDQTGEEIAIIERRHRARAGVEDHIRCDKDTGLTNLPFREFEHNRVWLRLIMLAHDLIAWTKTLLLTGELAACEPKRLRYRLLHVAARLVFHARKARLRLQATWPWAAELAAAYEQLAALPPAPR